MRILRRYVPHFFWFAILAPVLIAGAFAAKTRSSSAGLPNFHKVGPGIYRGGAPTQQGLRRLKDLGVDIIIDLRVERWAQNERRAAEKMGITWIPLPMGREAPTKKQVATCLATLANAAQHPVFVHCQHGADRTGCMVGIYRVRAQGWSFARAWEEMRRYGFNPRLAALKEAVRTRARTR